MTEEEWLSAIDPTPMLEFLGGKSSDRKLRLFAVASCRGTAWSMFPNDQCREAINQAEQFADGAIGWKELWEVRDAISGADASIRNKHSAGYSWQMREYWANVASEAVTIPVTVPQLPGTCGFLRDIFGNPFRPIAFDHDWRTSTVVSLAQSMYESRDFSTMPILSDALQDAGCENEDILNHCRAAGPHVRGCWVIDLVLGKK